MKRPNILWYCTDQQRFDTIGALGNGFINTPRIDQFLATGTAFTHAYCQAPICTPSRSSFLTGMYPSALGVNGNGYEEFPRHHESKLLPHRLSKAGYDCGLVGKLHLASPAMGQEPRVEDGYRYFQYSHDHKGPRDRGHDYAQWIADQGMQPEDIISERAVSDPANYRLGAKLKAFGGLYEPSPEQDNIPPHLHQTHWCTERALDFMATERSDQQPWFLSVNPFDPHPPFDAPWEYYRRYDPSALPGSHFEDSDLKHQQKLVDAGVDFQSTPRHPDELQHREMQASYYAMIEQLDHEFGRLLDALEASGEAENTIVIFTADHGETLGDHGLVLKGCRFMEGLVRVPLIIAWPGHYKAGQQCDALVELLDIAPTISEAAGMDLPWYNQGKSLTDVLKGRTTEHRDSVRTEFFGAINYPDQTHATMFRQGRWKLVSYHDKNLFELYDLQEDPWEHRDLSELPEHRDTLLGLLTQSFDRQVAAAPPMPERTAAF